jgi:hypothetical protein
MVSLKPLMCYNSFYDVYDQCFTAIFLFSGPPPDCNGFVLYDSLVSGPDSRFITGGLFSSLRWPHNLNFLNLKWLQIR